MATGSERPYPYQERLATAPPDDFPELLHAPTDLRQGETSSSSRVSATRSAVSAAVSGCFERTSGNSTRFGSVVEGTSGAAGYETLTSAPSGNADGSSKRMTPFCTRPRMTIQPISAEFFKKTRSLGPRPTTVVCHQARHRVRRCRSRFDLSAYCVLRWDVLDRGRNIVSALWLTCRTTGAVESALLCR